MMRRVSLRVVDAVWRALQDGPDPGQPNALPTFVDRFRDAALVPGYVVGDLVDDHGLRDLAHAKDFLGAFDVAPVAGFARPGARSRMALGTNYVALPDVAGLLIKLERLGLAIDPAPLVEALRPRLAVKPILTRSELDIWWFNRERHRGESVTLVGDEDGVVGASEVRTANGYLAEAWIAADGRAAQLWVRAPRYRRRRIAA